MKNIKLPLTILGILLVVIPCWAQNNNREEQERLSRLHWNRMLDLLDISLPDTLPPPAEDPNRPAYTFQEEGSSNWTDEEGNTYIRGPWGKWTNYEEAKANPYPQLPDPLKLNDGTTVTSPELWWKQKRPEIRRYFSEEIYGEIPKKLPDVNWKVLSASDTTINGIAALKKKLIGQVDNSAYPAVEVNIELTLVTPADAKTKVPAMIHLGYDFPPDVELPESYDRWKFQVLQKGWGYATYIPTSVQSDHGAGLNEGIIGLVNKGQLRTPDDWGALRAWAWVASNALDYLKQDANVDAQKVGIEGASRYGKAALVAMAYDPRFAIALIGSSGKGGATLFRRNYGETIGILGAAGEFHWFAGNLIKYAGPLNASHLKVDTHELIALCAPRPVFISTGSPEVEGRWMDNKGQFLAAKHAGSVYELLDKKGVRSDSIPNIGVGLMEGEIAFRQHEGGHTDAPNWPYFLEFASRYLSD